MANLFWLSDKQWPAIERLVTMNRRGMKPKWNRKVISGIMHVLQIGCRLTGGLPIRLQRIHDGL